MAKEPAKNPPMPVFPRAYLAMIGTEEPFIPVLYDVTGAKINMTEVQKKNVFFSAEKKLKEGIDGPEIDGKAYVVLGVYPLQRTFRLLAITHCEEEVDANCWVSNKVSTQR